MEEIGSLRRVRRQTAPSCSNQWDESQCEAAILVSTTANKIDICTETYMLENCCPSIAHMVIIIMYQHRFRCTMFYEIDHHLFNCIAYTMVMVAIVIRTMHLDVG